MIIETQSVEQTVSAIAEVLAKYLNPEEIKLLTTQWRQHPAVSIKLIQQFILETTRRYPELQAHKSEIRRGFLSAMQGKVQQPAYLNKYIEPVTASEMVKTFQTVMKACSNQLSAPDRRNFFIVLHQAVSQERTFRGHEINVSSFLSEALPVVPDDIYILNNLVQLVYVCLCDIVGPIEADEILYSIAETAKRQHPKAMVEKLF